MKNNVKVERADGANRWRVLVSGTIDEDTVLVNTLSNLKGEILFDLEGVAGINSCGIREWVTLIRTLEKTCRVEYEKVSVSMIQQFNMILNARGHGRVLSFKAPYFCDPCDRTAEALLTVAELPGADRGEVPEKLPPVTCEACGQEMEFDDLPEKYFIFLEQQARMN